MSVYCVAMFTEVSMQALVHPVSQYPVYPLYASSSGTPPLLKCDCQCWIIVIFNRGESAGVERTVFYLRHTMDVSFSHSFKMYLNLEKSLKANPQEHK